MGHSWRWLARLPAITLALMGLAMASGPAASEAAGGEIEAIAQALFEDTEAPAIGLLVMDSGEVIAEMALGERALGSGVAVQPGDLWHVGSITKSMTATLVARLAEDGALSWDLTIGEALGGRIDAIDPAFQDVTFAELLTHTSGLAPNIGMVRFLQFERTSPDARQERLDYAAEMLTRGPAGTPRETFAYSNAGYIVAGAMVETVMGARWEELVTAHVFTPLGITSAGFGAQGSPETVDQPRGHKPVFLGFGRTPVVPGGGADNPEVLGPAGRVHMRLEDLATYANAHLTGQTPDGAAFLSEESLRRLHTPRQERYAMGWVVQEGGARPGLLWHNGSNTTNYAEVYADPGSGLVIAMAANDHDARGLGIAFRASARRLFAALGD
ncbi:MAG: serine hydrolase domain-containing protein [Pseudomonadota bacterium]